ncbi:MAG: glycosyltransferase family 4 protein [Candidatus Aureabacteria bacterium]|nr:glycosyltransferase family 4 protein [Candidatus Auribacterota bacterium]
MKLLWLTDDYLPRRGGSRVVYHSLCSRIKGDQVRVVTRRMPGDERFDAQNPYRIIRVRTPLLSLFEAFRMRDAGMVLPLLWGAWRAARRERPDVIHCGEVLASGLAGYLVSRMFSIPFIIWIHDNPLGPASRLRYRVRKFICMRADGIAAASSFARDEAVGVGIPEEKIALILPGVDLEVFAPSDSGKMLRKRLGIGDKKILLTIARLRPFKGQDRVIRVLPQLVRLHPDLVYLVGGDGPDRSRLERLARTIGVGDRVMFAGFIPQDEIPHYYNACDLFIMLNREEHGVSWEGCGLVFLEAGACGKAVIGGKSGGVGESVIDGVTGILVHPENEEEIIGAIDLLMRDSRLREKMGKAAMEHVRSKFRWEESAAAMLAASEKIVRARHREERD